MSRRLTGSRPAVSRSALLVLLAYICYMIALHRWGPASHDSGGSTIADVLFLDFTRLGNFSLSRAPAAVHLERLLDADTMIGVCYNQKPMLPRVPGHVCQELQCLWAEDLQLNIDVWNYAMRVVPGPTEFKATQCAVPRGGQGPVPAGQQPTISFVVTMHNNAYVTAQCLLELFRTAQEVPSAEYVVVDDGSTEDTTALTQMIWRLQEIFKVRVLFQKNENAVGYGAANDQGIRLSSGKYIALVNNDMFAVKGWLSAIMQTFEHNPRAGIVGPMFVGNGDLVTEAGGLVFSDAQAANFGRGKEPHHATYFLRAADYVSAACVVLPRRVYTEVGGFDFQYSKGYYEDTDLAMAVRAAGYDVLVQPLAVNFHQEGTTFGTDATSETKLQLMKENREKFFNKWRPVLEEKHCPPDTDQFPAFHRGRHPRLLWVDDIVPEPDRDSGSVRNMHLLRILLDAGYHVTFAPTAGGRKPHYATRLRHMGVHVFPIMPPQQWMLLHNGKCMFDVVMVARRLVFEMAQGQIAQHCPGAPIVYDTVDLHFLREARQALAVVPREQQQQQQQQGSSTWKFEDITTTKVLDWMERSPAEETRTVRHTRDSELYFIDKSKLTIVVSPAEAEVIQFYRPRANVAVVTNIHDIPVSNGSHRCETRSGTLFVGNMNHIPNRQAIAVLINDVLPIVLRLLPAEERREFKMNIVGANVVPDSLRELFQTNSKHVVFHGFLSDEELYQLHKRVKLAVAPLISGAGVKGKVNQAMKLGLPVVATPIAVEGMFAKDGEDCLIGTTPEEFAEKVVRLHSDCALWSRLVKGGLRNVRKHFSLEKARKAFTEALISIGRGPMPESLRGACLGRLENASSGLLAVYRA